MKFTLPELTYSYDALEPFIDEMTMKLHHTKHHQTYIDKLNTAVAKYQDLEDMPVEDLLGNLESLQVEEMDKKAIRNHGGGHANHSLFWQIMAKEKNVDGNLVSQIKSEFGSLEDFKKKFSETAANLFGSGWAWLSRDEKGKLYLEGLSNQDSPYLTGKIPILGLDVWEHAYYLKYQNRRAEYIENWWNVLKLI